MSSLARWTYTNTATVRPFLDEDLETGVINYGPEFTIACTWIAESKEARDARGAEFVTRNRVYLEDDRPKYRDLITLNDGSGLEQEIRDRTAYDMSMHGDTPDYELVT